MKIVTIIGARPQIIKAAAVSRLLRLKNTEVLVHTGQHYDDNLSTIFFRELGFPEPDYNLNIGSGTHGEQTGRMLAKIEEIVIKEQPDYALVYGDTNSTLAGALAAVKLQVPVAHVEAGLRSFNRAMPEEHNRVLTDHCSELLFCPTRSAVEQLARENISAGVHLSGDVMYDALLHNLEIAQQYSSILNDLNITPRNYVLATLHRPYNTDNPHRLNTILSTFRKIDLPIIFPIHPRTRKKINALNISSELDASNISMIEPIGYRDMLILEKNAYKILTDSGGMQKEAYFMAVPCLTLRPETEWVETVTAGWNILVDVDQEKTLQEVQRKTWPTDAPEPVFGDGQAAVRIVDILQTQCRAT